MPMLLSSALSYLTASRPRQNLLRDVRGETGTAPAIKQRARSASVLRQLRCAVTTKTPSSETATLTASSGTRSGALKASSNGPRRDSHISLRNFGSLSRPAADGFISPARFR